MTKLYEVTFEGTLVHACHLGRVSRCRQESHLRSWKSRLVTYLLILFTTSDIGLPPHVTSIQDCCRLMTLLEQFAAV